MSRASLLILILSGVVTACATHEQAPTTVNTEVIDFQLGTGDSWTLDHQQSVIAIEVFRGGRLANLGHNHVIEARDITGTARLPENLEDVSFTLNFNVADLVVDDAEARARAGQPFQDPVENKDIAGTRKNMLSADLLNAAQFPQIEIHSSALTKSGDAWQSQVVIVIKGRQQRLQLPTKLANESNRWTATGSFEVSHTQLGLQAFSVMLGALRVEETMNVRYHLEWVRQN